MTDIDPSPIASQNADLPPISAIYLVKFDVRVGYSIAWKQSIDEVDVEGIEYKCLPSGLHNLKEDLVYFAHDGCAGISIFVNSPAPSDERAARLLSVGILVPLASGRLGRCWLHAEKLRALALELAGDIDRIKPLEDFWQLHRLDKADSRSDTISSPILSRSDIASFGSPQNRGRALSNATAILPAEQCLPPSHPALSMLVFLERFGPLVFPLHRAALLRKRILLVAPPPVRTNCEYVYDISVLSSLPSSLHDLFPSPGPIQRLQPLFCVGVHDIPELSASKSSSPWVACTTDEVLAMKKDLYDIIVHLPAEAHHIPAQKCWPTIRNSDDEVLSATQRDLRRYKALINELRRLHSRPQTPSELVDCEGDGSHSDISRLSQRPGQQSRKSGSQSRIDSARGSEGVDDTNFDDMPLEKTTISELAYSTFMWWASAGERDDSLSSESEQDRALLFEIVSRQTVASGLQDDSGHMVGSWRSGLAPKGIAHVQTALVAFFHRLTCMYLCTLADLVDEATEEDDSSQLSNGERGYHDDDDASSINGAQHSAVITMTTDDVARMGLDSWSAGNRVFAAELMELYFERHVTMKGATFELCGLRVC